jgi:glutamate synthase domain-containing protein 3
MSGGIAYVLDEEGKFPVQVNKEMVELEDLSDESDQQKVLELIQNHVRYTDSSRGQYVLDNWPQLISKFVKVMPTDYKRALAAMHKQHNASGAPAAELQGAARG